MITKDIAEKLEESIKNIGGAIDESTPYMDNYCHQINFKINNATCKMYPAKNLYPMGRK